MQISHALRRTLSVVSIPRGVLGTRVNLDTCRIHVDNTAAKRLRMRQIEHFRSLFQSLSSQIKISRASSASFCVQLVVQLFYFMLLVFLTIS